MAVLGRLARTASAGRKINASKTIIPSLTPSCNLLCPPFQRSFEHQIHSSRSEMWRLLSAPNFSGKYFLFPAVLAGLFGGAMLDIAYADTDEAAAKPPLPSASPSSYELLVEIAHKERKRVEDSLRSRGVKHGSYPQFNVAVKGQKVTIKFQVPTTCEIPQLIANLVSHLGLKVEERSGGSHMALRAWDNAVAWQLALTYPKAQKEIGVDQGRQGDLDTNEDLCILIFRPLISSDKAEIEFMKTGGFSPKEIDALVSILQFAGTKLSQNKAVERKPREGSARIPNAEKSASNLEAMGVKIYGLDEPHGSSINSDISWDNIAGYDQQKREIEDTILLSLQSPEVYDDIARGTRRKFESNRPRAILFEGPPGTGKTSSARVIANQSGFPLLYVPLEVVLSKYYGESERLLGKVFSLANELPNGAIIFLDEVDSFAVARDSEMHEATRRILSVLLRQIDGFEQDKKVVVIAATNRKQDLDPALISRFDSMITFGLPDQQNRQEIAAQYAKHLTKSELEDFAKITEHMSGRDIRDICQQAERSWAAKIIRGRANQTGEQRSLPPLQEYIESAINRRNALLGIEEQRILDSQYRTRKAPLDLA
ncbi:P-loop containing nucleoside triphosphate hydrolases superfamily protein isoform 1 [Tripterygium wilfordii]|uniref:P-loop containing nucleoside triphosphate hydrolases superfamily protein isoform 1 n=1 Tax=Tripterygium wilfordii TaxID=458696 RepID=A0A7J7C554_TRIWF|nr:meiotic spindle formation protein mei-1 [Tripterygium wilfordii]KAF5728896.1 P-loop containing nucleoside triphosphate hydrolases superfamily protein isoform 1 [Tripterygium wilfordii]